MRRLAFAALALVFFCSPVEAQNISRSPAPAASTTVPGVAAYGTAAGTAAQGNDSRITGAAQQSGVTTWTPSDASGASLTFTAVSAAYTQIGNMVFAYGTVTYPSTANGSNAIIGNLPVASPNQAYSQQCNLTYTSITTAAHLLLAKNLANPTFVITNTAGVALTNATMSTGQIFFECIYPAA